MTVRRLILVLGAAVLIAGVIALFTPVSVSGGNDVTLGCGNAVASDLSAAREADDKSGANVPILNQFIPHTNYVTQCQAGLSHRRAWSMPLAVAGVIVIAGALLVRGRPVRAAGGGLAPPAP
jgi:hypothetical protein